MATVPLRMSHLRFGRHSLDVETGTLRRDGVVVPLQTQPAALLIFLAERAGSIITREEIRAYLWGDTVVSYDQSINYCIRQIRIALTDDAALVQTIPRRGYRMPLSAVQSVNVMAPAPGGAGRRVRVRVAAAAVVAALVSGFALGSMSRGGRMTVRQFVTSHLAHPDRCPYLRFFVGTRSNS